MSIILYLYTRREVESFMYRYTSDGLSAKYIVDVRSRDLFEMNSDWWKQKKIAVGNLL